MPRITDYATLLQSIASFAIRTGDVDFEDACPLFVQLAETRLGSDLRTREMEAYVTMAPGDDGFITLPDDFLDFRSLLNPQVGADPLEFVSPETYAAWGPGAGISLGYTVIGNRVQTFPTTSGPLSALYYRRLPPLTETQPTNWLLSKYPNLYLYASLLESAPFMKEDSRSQLWQAYYNAALAAANRDDTRTRYGLGVTRVTQDTP